MVNTLNKKQIQYNQELREIFLNKKKKEKKKGEQTAQQEEKSGK